MPGNVQTYTPTAVFPQVFVSVTEAHEWTVQEDSYPDGTSQRRLIPDGSPLYPRRKFTATLRLTAGDMATLMDFYAGQDGGTVPFFFYHPWHTSPKFTYDATGTETTGRYTVRFNGPLTIEWKPPRGTVNIELIEVT